MTFTNTPVYVVDNAQGWQEKHREHPAIAWQWEMEKKLDYGNLLNEGYEEFVTDDFTFTSPDNITTKGREAAWAKVKEMYQFFTAQYHEPEEYIIWETNEGWKLMGRASMYVNFPVPLENASTVKDLNGEEWHFKLPATFKFEWVKDPSGPKGLKIKEEVVVADGLPLMNQLVKRGMVTWEQVAALVNQRAADN
jgi:hypothetical protein